MQNLSGRLLELRKSKRQSQKELARVLEISIREYQYYEHGQRYPTYQNLLFLADYFEVSLDYLVGRTDRPAINR